MPVIFYDLVSVPGGTFFSPNTYKARLSLLHKGVPFTTREVTYNDLRTHLKERFGVKKLIVPTIELSDGSIISSSANIARWLEETYPGAPSLYLPTEATPVDQTSSAYILAKNYATLVDSGFGDSDPEWSTFWELSAAGIQASLNSVGPLNDGDYMKSDEKLGAKGEWDRLMSLDQSTLIQRAEHSLIPVESVLTSTQFLAGTAPGYVDYVVYGRYMMMAAGCPHLAVQIWRSKRLINDWITRLELIYSEGLQECIERMPSP
ncbi:glutathione S-transferase [Meredithblackwellia eburnea MCA 4105]